jgi:short-subunit dehydrogenase
MSKITITGANSNIAKEFIKIIFDRDKNIETVRHEDLCSYYYDSDKFLFCNGILYSKTSLEQTKEEIKDSIFINYSCIAFHVAKILDYNPMARICIIGSESAYVGSYDDTYVTNKKLIHNFIEYYPLNTKYQQLVGISPGIIKDTGMTERRQDRLNLLNKELNHPMNRFVTSYEVAKLAFTLLYEQPYINKTIVRMHGGNY